MIAGKDKGKTGTISHVLRDRDMVVIDDVNMVTKHQKNRRRASQGQIIERPMPIHVSNVALVEDGKPVRAGYKIEGEGEKRTKVRVARPSGKKI